MHAAWLWESIISRSVQDSVAFGLGEPLEPLELVLGVFSEILGVLGVLGSRGSRGFTRSSRGFSGRPQGVPGVCPENCGVLSLLF